jgi:hypothetical protein
MGTHVRVATGWQKALDGISRSKNVALLVPCQLLAVAF